MVFKKLIALCLLIACALAAGLYTMKENPQFFLKKTTFNALPEWKNENFVQAMVAFKQSCTEILKRPSEAPFSSLVQSGKNRNWQTICTAANHLSKNNSENIRHFFETWFTPYQVRRNFNSQGLFTGYYLPTLEGRLKANKEFSIPIFAIPNDLVKVDLGLFRPELSGKIAIGQLKQKILVPYPDRAAITKGALQKTAPILAWSNSKLDLFFAQIQGSALLKLPHHQSYILSYAGNNGRPYTAIGSVLLNKKALLRQHVSMQSIHAWLQAHPDQIDEILNQNASYVFFSILKSEAPLGAERVPLTAERSLAIDTRYIPLGTPVWLVTSLPTKSSPTSFQHLLVAQDTGGAIKGIIRGDIYWGSGTYAALIAGKMKQQGQYWVLMPRETHA